MSAAFPCDSQELVEMCLARLRPILPTIEEIELRPDEDDTLDFRIDEIIIDDADVADVKGTPAANRAAPRPARWPVVLCGLIATYSGVTAVIWSPMGARPEMQQVAKAVSTVAEMTESLVRF